MSNESALPSDTRSIQIDASPEQVWIEVGDISGLGVHSPETVKTEWLGGASAPEVGAVFRGHNAQSGFEWTTECTITKFVENEVFSFGVDWDDHDEYSTEWSYELVAKDGGTELTESYVSAYLAAPENQTRPGRDEVLAGFLEETLRRIKTAVEAPAI